ncbi:P-loop containing nucleoside triphosphate hydrolase, partial [Abortiporus biennis]
MAPRPKSKKNPYTNAPPVGEESQSSHTALAKEPFFGFVPRHVTAKQVKKVMDGGINPFTKQSFTTQYKRLLESRKKLPVYTQMEGFYEMFNENQILIVAGETGAGKTTQIPQFVCYTDLPHTKGKLVCCTQPRRVAAMSVAKRVADEMD